MKKTLVGLLLAGVALASSAEGIRPAAERGAWFREARFGMFIHWGIYSIPAKGEWNYCTQNYRPGEYEAFAKKFNPVNYRPREWARLAKAAGMKYAVLTSRHHDGFCMFDSHFTDYKITNTPYGRDAVREFVEAFRAEGLKVGFYHSLPDWTHPGYADSESPECMRPGGKRTPHVPTPAEYASFTNLVYNHINQLTTEYGKIDLLFCDYTSQTKAFTDYFGRDAIMEMVYRNQPDILLNDRLSYYKEGVPDFDYYTPEICVPNQPQVVKGVERMWETCATMNDNWGYCRTDENWKTPEAIVAGLVGCVSKNGNLLLNIGPTELGEVPGGSVRILKRLADWYAANGESVTGAGRSAYAPPHGCVYTQKGDVLYCHFLQSPLGDTILPQLRGKIAKATLLRTGEDVDQTNGWGFELLKADEQRLRTRGIRPGDVIRLDLCEMRPPEAGANLSAGGVLANGRVVRDFERKVFADGEAIRYVLPGDGAKVACERTEWVLPTDATVWYQPETSSYEDLYVRTTVGRIRVGSHLNLPITAKLADGTYRLITEANVVGYTDSNVEYRGAGRFAIRFYAEKGPFATSARTTPWRVTLVAKDLQTLATSDIVRRLCPPPSPAVAAACAKFVKPGRSVWQWLPDNSPRYAEQKAWYDRTKALGYEYYLIDDGWRDWRDGDRDQWACLKKWIDYGKSIGVESFMWVHSKEMLSAVTRRPYLEKVKAAGAVGIKIDFMPPASCEMMRWYEETLAETLEFGLMTDFHGAVKPTGRERTWPHEVAREAIRGHEWHVTRYNRVLPPEHDCILPFCRLVQGHADYTPMVFEKRELQGYTWARELAQGVIFSAPFLCFGDYPKNYLENPAAEMIRALPAVYDEMRVLPGSEIGECVAVAKRRGDDWFVAVENGAAARTLSIRLDFLGARTGTLVGFGDAPDRPDAYAVGRRTVGASDTVELKLRPCGGYAAWIRPTR